MSGTKQSKRTVRLICRLIPQLALSSLLFASAGLLAQTSSLVTLTQSASPLAVAKYDAGAAPADLPMERMLLLLKPSDVQSQQLATYLQQVQDPHAGSYHHWLTPAQFGQLYGASKEHQQVAAAWLQQQGFTVNAISPGGQWIEFSGTVAQVEAAFYTSLHRYVVNNDTRIANATDLRIPASLSSFVAGVVSMSDFALQSAQATEEATAENEVLTPTRFATLYNLAPLYRAGTMGAGQSIAIVERSNIDAEDVAAFRTRFSLPPNTPQIIVNGSDPGRTTDEPEALLDASWAGAIAPKATVKLIASASTRATDGIDLSIAYAVDHAVASVLDVGYAACERNLPETHRQFYSAMWAQAAAEGISVIVAAGNNGAASCEEDVANGTGLSVNGIASTPYNTAVGGTSIADFTAAQESGWSAADGVRAGGGGLSAAYATPDWQVAGGTTGQHRSLPDLSLDAANAYALCVHGGCVRGEIASVSGTSVAAAAFAGVMALVDEFTQSAQGNAAPSLYALSRKGLVFRDVTTGSNRVSCFAGSEGCDASGMAGYWAASGFDLATGLGSIDAAALVKNFAAAAATGTGKATVSLSPTTVNVLAGSTFAIAAIVTPADASGAVPTGTVSFTDSATGTLGTVSLTNGKTSFTAPASLSAGTHTLTGQYSGDGNYAAATSAPITANVVQGAAVMALTSSSPTPAYGTNLTATATLQATTTVNKQQPTGSITFTIDNTSVGTAILQPGTDRATATLAIATPTPGNHMLGATYAGDANFAALTASPVSLATTKGVSVTRLTAEPSSLAEGVPISLTATISRASSDGPASVIGFTGNVVFYDGDQPIGTHNQVAVSNNQATLANVTLDPTVEHVLTAQYYGDGNWAASTSAPLTLTAAPAATVTELTVSSTAGFSGSPITFTAAVTAPAATSTTAVPTGTVTFLDGTKTLGTGTLAVTSGEPVATFSTSALSDGSHSVTAKYAGDTKFAASTSPPVTVTISSLSIAPDTTNLTVAAGQSGTVSFTVASDLSVPVEFSCQPPVGTDTGCSFAPPSVNGNGKTTLTITTQAPGTANLKDSMPFTKGVGVTVLSCVVLICMPIGQRFRRFLQCGALVLLLAGAIFFPLGCGSDSTKAITPGTPSGVQVFTVTASVTVNNQTTTQQFYISVNVTS